MIGYTKEMNTLHLTQKELPLFAALPDSLREGWQTEPETAVIQDEPPRKLVRLKLLTLRDPSLQSLQQKLSSMNNPEEAASLLASVDLSAVPYDDLAELVFAMGPASMSVIIAHLLESAQSDEQLEDLSALTFLRHELLSTSHS